MVVELIDGLWQVVKPHEAQCLVMRQVKASVVAAGLGGLSRVGLTVGLEPEGREVMSETRVVHGAEWSLRILDAVMVSR
jgi:hypothetical protein